MQQFKGGQKSTLMLLEAYQNVPLDVVGGIPECTPRCSWRHTRMHPTVKRKDYQKVERFRWVRESYLIESRSLAAQMLRKLGSQSGLRW